MDADVLIVGAGVAGLSLAYFLSKINSDLKIIVIDKKKKIGYPIRDTGLVSHHLFEYIKLPKNIILHSYKKAKFCYGKECFDVKASKGKMFLLDRPKLDEAIYNMLVNRENVNVYLNTELKDIVNKRVAITSRFFINYKVIVDATGPYSYVRALYNLPTKRSYALGIEEILSGKYDKSISLFFNKQFSSNYFGWKLCANTICKIGLMDANLKISKFKLFKKYVFNSSKKGTIYSHIIKKDIERILSKDNMICVGESTGYVKQFSLGGITFAVIQSYIASKVINAYFVNNTHLYIYNFIIPRIFSRFILYGNIFRTILKNRVLFSIINSMNLYRLASLLDVDSYGLSKIQGKL